MSHSFTTQQLTGMVPHTVSQAGEPAARRTPGPIGRAFARMRSLASRGGTINELRQFSDRELADIGLNRCDVPRVFDPTFAAEYSQRG